ncbi:DUF4365 domain-containing protein [Sorangium sp. So ce327]|uniref:DUF4365 domain-containing protein n=1 Tax=Sorangium sp. So ce327 TaxID=3133301 RepID=UPI003F5F3EB8
MVDNDSQTSKVGVRMSKTIINHGLVARRGELMAELFLQGLDPLFVGRNSVDLGFDFIVGFRNPRGGLNLVAVEAKATGRPVKSKFQISRHLHDILSKSNVPGLLLVVDVKTNRYYCAELTSRKEDEYKGKDTISVPVVELNEESRIALAKRLSSAP